VVIDPNDGGESGEGLPKLVQEHPIVHGQEKHTFTCVHIRIALGFHGEMKEEVATGFVNLTGDALAERRVGKDCK
jgi:hypothetical protein